MEEKPLVSVIIPCYNYGRFLPDCLNSLLNQELKNWECVLVDNGSTDDTNEVCKKYVERDHRFVLLVTENKGPSAGRNSGLKISRGKYIQFLDADDLLQRNKLKFQSEYLESHQEIDLVYSQAYYFEGNIVDVDSISDGNASWMPGVSGKGKAMIDLLIRRNVMPINSALFRMELIKKAGSMDEQLRGYEDWDLFLRFAISGGGFQYLPSIGTLAMIRKHSTSLSREPYQMDIYRATVLQKTIFNSIPFTSKLFVIFRYFQQRSHLLMKRFKGKKIKFINSDKIASPKIWILNLFSLLYLPVYIVIESLRFILKPSKG